MHLGIPGLKQTKILLLIALAAWLRTDPAASAEGQTTSPRSDQAAGDQQQPLLRQLSPADLPPPAGQQPGAGPTTQQDIQSRQQLQDVAEEAIRSSGAIFVDPEQIYIKPPMLSALITLNRTLSPYQLDASSENEVSLRDVLQTAVSQNLNIKISQQDSQMKKWNYVGALSKFLPDISNDISVQGLRGNYASPGGVVIGVNNNFISTSNMFNYYLFRGGATIFGAKQAKHQYKASKFAVNTTVNDELQQATNAYYELALNDALLQIRLKGVEVAKAYLIVMQDQFDNGVNTYLDVLQAKYELSRYRQDLIKQQIARRESAIKLATVLNLNPATDLSLKNRQITKLRLVDASLGPADLLKIAIDNRPELKVYDELRKAAKDAVKVARAAFFPTVAFSGNVIGTGTRASSISNLASSQQTPLSSSGVGVGSISGGSSLPLGSSSGGQPHETMRSLFVLGLDIQWNLGGLGLQQTAQLEQARADARKVQLEFNRELARIYEQVRDSYLKVMSTENLIAETTDAVKYAEEKLRLTIVRIKEGVGTTLDVIQAQRDYTAALTDKARAIIQFNVAEAELVRDIGRSSINNLSANVPLKD